MLSVFWTAHNMQKKREKATTFAKSDRHSQNSSATSLPSFPPQLLSIHLQQVTVSHFLCPALSHLPPSSSPLPPPTPPPLHHSPSLNWESGRAVEIALTRALPGCAIHLLFYYAAPGLPGRCRSICHRPRSLITGICHRPASLLMLSSPP